MTILWLAFMAFAFVAFAGVLRSLFDGQKLQPSARETLIRRCEGQHAALMDGNERLGVYGKWPPAEGVDDEFRH